MPVDSRLADRETDANGIAHGLGSICGGELVVDVTQVVTDRPGTDSQPSSYLFIRQANRYLLKDHDFARRQLFRPTANHRF